jgi:hypothetical protein
MKTPGPTLILERQRESGNRHGCTVVPGLGWEGSPSEHAYATSADTNASAAAAMAVHPGWPRGIAGVRDAL